MNRARTLCETFERIQVVAIILPSSKAFWRRKPLTSRVNREAVKINKLDFKLKRLEKEDKLKKKTELENVQKRQ